MFGLRITGDTGNVQVYSGFLNMGLLKKGTTSTPSGEGNHNWLVPVNLGYKYPKNSMLFIRPRKAGQPVYAAMAEINGVTRLLFGSQDPAVVDWYIFGPPDGALVPEIFNKYGLRVRDEKGNISYSSQQKLLRISGMAKIGDAVDTYTPLSTMSLPTPPGRVMAGYISMSREYIDSEGPPDGGGPYSYFHMDGVAVNSNNIQSKEVVGGSIISTGTVILDKGGLLIAADVTDY